MSLETYDDVTMPTHDQINSIYDQIQYLEHAQRLYNIHDYKKSLCNMIIKGMLLQTEAQTRHSFSPL